MILRRLLPSTLGSPCIAALAVIGLSLCGCGYRIAGPSAAALKLRTLAIPTLRNSTPVFQLEQRLTRALIDTFAQRSPYRITSTEAGADAAIQGEVIELSAVPVIIGNESFGTTFLVTLRTRLRIIDLRTSRILFRNDNFLFREQYVINADVREFFSEINPAVDRMARDFAQSVVATVLSGD